MAKLTLTPAPTFTANVPIPVPGKGPVNVQFTFKARGRAEFQSFLAALEGKSNVEVVMMCATGWELEDAFDAESIGKLDEAYLGAARAILDTYMAQIAQARLGN